MSPVSVSLQHHFADRRPEIERAVLARVQSVCDPAEVEDARYAQGLRSAVLTAIDYSLAAIDLGEEKMPPVPAGLLAQARLAARSGVSLDTVLRRYFAGFALLSDYLMEEAQGGLAGHSSLQERMGALAAVLDGIIAAVSDEYSRALPGASGSTEQRRISLVCRLLSGEQLDAELAYDFDRHHLGVVACGPGAEEAIRDLMAQDKKRLLSVVPEPDACWAWLGSIEAMDPERLKARALKSLPSSVRLAVGEPTTGIEGWRLTHRQARAALPIAASEEERVVRYADVAILASIRGDELLARSLRQIYLEPLEEERDGGEVLRQTLRAYLAAQRNVSSAAVVLGVRRHTISDRLRAAEERIKRPLPSCLSELEVALQLESLG
ncbi:MAG TPA: helix-turn-helix domain-containing protein [Solirubrobacterales bacterium]|nr:helix-turn-helix domain-containing protein [Solirubrobacterales bacterium]